MKRKLIIIGIILIVILAGIWILYRLFFDFEPREPKNEIPVTYNIGWWSHQSSLNVDSISVRIVESKLNLFNSFSLIEYKIKGRLIYKPGGWEPRIGKVHISESSLMDSLAQNEKERLFYFNDNSLKNDFINIRPQAIICITPIVSMKENEKYKGREIPFEFTNELKIQSLDWGNNYILIKCGKFEKGVVLKQRK